MSEEKLRVYFNECDWVIARDADDAWAVLLDQYGGRREDHADYDHPDFWEPLPDEKPLTIVCDDSGSPNDRGDGVRLTAAEWVERNGRGYLGSTEY